VLADEPTGNLDVRSGAAVLDLLARLHAERGLTVVMATHSEEAASRCPSRLRLEDGRILEHAGLVEVDPDDGASA
jgi:ABC-type lipoprotein export system ATPase subunit